MALHLEEKVVAVAVLLRMVETQLLLKQVMGVQALHHLSQVLLLQEQVAEEAVDKTHFLQLAQVVQAVEVLGVTESLEEQIKDVTPYLH